MNETYILNTNEQARKRLELQHQLYAKSSINLLHEAGISRGMQGLEIGSGSGAMTMELARLIGKDGKLLAIDLSQNQIDSIKKVTSAFDNIEFKVWDANYLSDLGEYFDFIYCRMVLHHVSDAHSIIQQMKSCLKPGGLIICEEPSIFDSTFCFPKSDAYNLFTEWVRSCFSKNNRDYEIAHRLEQEFASCNFEITHHSLFQPLLRTTQEKEIYFMALNDIKPQLIDLKIASADDIEKLSEELKKLSDSVNTMSWIRMHNIIAKAQD